MTTPLVFLDTETDGVHPDRKVWEAAMIYRDEHGQLSFRMFIDIDLSTADPFGLKVGGFYDRHPMGRILSDFDGDLNDYAPDVLSGREAAFKVAQITHGAHLVGAVPNFDAEVLAHLLRGHGFIPSWHHHLIDVEAMAVGYLAAKGQQVATVRPWKSDELSRACGVEPPSDGDRHTAMGDARWAMRWYDAMTGGAA